MKISRGDAFYVQLVDLMFFGQPQFGMPKSLTADLADVFNNKKDKHDFIQIRGSGIEFLSSIQWIDDFDEIGKLTKEEITERIAALMKEASHSRRIPSDEGHIEFTCMIHQISLLSDYVSFKKGVTTWHLPEGVEPPSWKKKRLSIREYFEFI